jgi:RNA polymerase sigma factor for flagellar operon FliA
MNSLRPSAHPGLHSIIPSQPPAKSVSIAPGIRVSSAPPRISIVPGSRISILPRTPVRPTLPPKVRAARMMATVRKVASRLARRLPRHIDIEDLVGAGSLGLADAYSRRGTMPGWEFEAFAVYRIRGAMLDELRRLDAMPRRSRRSAKKLASACRSVEQKLGRPAVQEEVAAELGLEMSAYQALRAKIDASRAPVPFSALGSEEEDATQELADPKDEAPDTLAARAQISGQIAARVSALPERMRFVLTGIYVDGTTLKQIGRALGVSESRVCQIHTEALSALRSTFNDGAPSERADAGAREAEESLEEAPTSVTRIRVAKAAPKARPSAPVVRLPKAS